MKTQAHLSLKKAVLAEIDQRALVELASKLTAFRSYSGQEADCANWLGTYLEEQGLDVTLQEVEPGRPNVVGRIPGDGSGASLMFNGHLDIDPVTEGYLHDPWTIEVREGKLWGHGLSNMKAGVASMIHAALAIKKAGVRPKGDIIVAAVVGELQSGLGTRHLVRAGVVPDLAIVPEPTNMNVRTKHSSLFTLLLRVRGKSGWHGSMHQYPVVNAVDKMADVIRGLRDLKLTHVPDPDMPGLPRTLIGTVIGGLGDEPVLWRPSFVPDACFITLEARVLPGMTVDGAVQDIESRLDELRKADPDLEVEVMRPPAAYREPWRANPIVMPALNLPTSDILTRSTVDNYRSVMNADPKRVGSEDPGSNAGTDAGHLFAAGAKALVFGPTYHKWGESAVSVDVLTAHCQICAGVAADVATTDRERWVVSD